MKNSGVGIKEITVYKCECERCGWDWTTKTFDLPKVCPKCKNHLWNEPRTKEGGIVAKKQIRKKLA